MQKAPAAIDPPGGVSISPGRFFATVAAIAGAIGLARLLTWAWIDVARPLFDAFVIRAVRRQRAEFEQYLRAEIFEDELAAAEIRERMTQEALRLAHACDESFRAIQATQADQARTLESVPRLADACERIDRSLRDVEKTMGGVRQEMGRQAGALEALQRSGTWDGKNRRDAGGPG